VTDTKRPRQRGERVRENIPIKEVMGRNKKRKPSVVEALRAARSGPLKRQGRRAEQPPIYLYQTTRGGIVVGGKGKEEQLHRVLDRREKGEKAAIKAPPERCLGVGGAD